MGVSAKGLQWSRQTPHVTPSALCKALTPAWPCCALRQTQKLFIKGCIDA